MAGSQPKGKPRWDTNPQEIRFLGEMQRLRPEPGDMFVLMCEQDLTLDDVDRMREQMQGCLNGAQVLVLGKGMRLGCVGAPPEVLDVTTVSSRDKDF